MPQFFYFFIRFKIFWVFVIFEAISLILVFNGNPYHRSVYINSANGLVGGIYSSSSNVKQYFHLKAINDSLVAENARLYTNIYSKDSSFHTKDTINFKDTTAKYVGRFVYIAADVVSNSTAYRNNYLMLNVGTADGVTRQCGVVCNDGVVGLIYDVSEHFCTVISLLNSNAKISAKLDSVNNAGTLLWNGLNPRLAQIDDINKHVKLETGQGISTSGLSYVFPRNIKIGEVDTFEVVGNNNHISVKLSTPFETLYKVYVVRNLDFEEETKLLNSIKGKQ
jgi:rod shape-determining protein MreC